LSAAHAEARRPVVRCVVARYGQIDIAEPAIRLLGQAGKISAPSLEHLAKTWAGEEYWYWARRVIRKLRHGSRADRGGPGSGSAMCRSSFWSGAAG
jgi:hypothetical protein